MGKTRTSRHLQVAVLDILEERTLLTACVPFVTHGAVATQSSDPPSTTTIAILQNGALINGPVQIDSSVQVLATIGGIQSGLPLNPNDTVTYTLYGPGGTGPNSVINTWVEPVGTASPLVDLTQAGGYGYGATFNGDSNYSPSWATSGGALTVGAIPTTTTISILQNGSPITGSIAVGSSVQVLATVGGVLSGTPLNSGDTVTYTLYGPGGTGPNSVIDTWVEPVGTASPLYTVSLSGGYGYSATFNGDSDYSPSWATSGGAFTVGAIPTTTTISILQNGSPITGPIAVGSSVQVLATVGGVLAGTPLNSRDTVTYTLYGPGGTGPNSVINTWIEPVGTPSPLVQVGLSGGYGYSATFNGDSNYSPSWATSGGGFTVESSPTTTTISILQNGSPITGSVTAGSSVQVLATVGGVLAGTPLNSSDTVTYTLYGPGGTGPNSVIDTWVEPVGTASPLYTVSLAGGYGYGATFNGDSNYSPSWATSGGAFTVVPASSFTVGKAGFVSATASTITMSTTAASGGIGSYTYQWYRSTTSGFTLSSANIIAGATGTTNTDTNVVAGTIYYYKVIETDSADDTGTSNQAMGQTLVSQPTAPGTVVTTLPMVIGVIGDSISAGDGATTGAATWLQTYLGEQQNVSVVNEAVSGSGTGSWLSTYLAPAIATFKADGVTVVQIMLGTNDCTGLTPAQFQSNMSSIIATLQANGFNQIVLMEPPAFNPDVAGNISLGRTEAALGVLQQYDAVLSSLANNTTVWASNLTSFVYFGENPQLLVDGTHPGNQGAQELGLEWAMVYENIFAGFTVQNS